jgi:hypothetical protein
MMRKESLTDYAIKMFDGLSKDGLTHEALDYDFVLGSSRSAVWWRPSHSS